MSEDQEFESFAGCVWLSFSGTCRWKIYSSPGYCHLKIGLRQEKPLLGFPLIWLLAGDLSTASSLVQVSFGLHMATSRVGRLRECQKYSSQPTSEIISAIFNGGKLWIQEAFQWLSTKIGTNCQIITMVCQCQNHLTSSAFFLFPQRSKLFFCTPNLFLAQDLFTSYLLGKWFCHSHIKAMFSENYFLSTLSNYRSHFPSTTPALWERVQKGY